MGVGCTHHIFFAAQAGPPFGGGRSRRFPPRVESRDRLRPVSDAIGADVPRLERIADRRLDGGNVSLPPINGTRI